MAVLIDGKAFAQTLRESVAADVSAFKARTGVTPGLAVVLVGQDPASQVYVRNKGIQTEKAGMNSFQHVLPAETSSESLLALVGELNANPDVHGILVQLPLPEHIDAFDVINAIDPAKDVDGFTLTNAGLLSVGRPGLVPCTPLGCMKLLAHFCGDLSGKSALVVGRSNIVGKPMAQLLLQANCTVTQAHSRSRDLPTLCREAEILVAATGRPRMIPGDWIRPGATVIDVGINRGADGKLCGDVDFESASKVAGAITPVPGGVGPMTIACLLENTLRAARGLSGEDSE